jgi:hypothetical protein
MTFTDRQSIRQINAHNARYRKDTKPMNYNSIRAIVCTLLILLSLFFAGCGTAYAQGKTPIKVFAVSAAADWISTYRFLVDKSGTEANPMLRFTHNRPIQTVLAGTAFDVAGVYAWKRVTRNHRRIQTIGLYAASGFRIYLAIHNSRMPKIAENRQNPARDVPIWRKTED